VGVGEARRRVPVRVAISNDFELVVAGIAAALAPYSERVRVVELAGGPDPEEPADVLLFDTFGRLDDRDDKLHRLIHESEGRVIVYSWEYFPAERAIDAGAYGYVFKGAPIIELVEAIEDAAAGKTVRIDHPTNAHNEQPEPFAWPGKAAGLSAREAEILTLITSGFSNAEIATHLYLSPNTVKTYIRTAYRKIGVTRRSQAVRWGLEHGMRHQVRSRS
jgi:NarL family two-component system response regulator LiaR